MIKESDRLSLHYHSGVQPEIEHYSWMFLQDFSQNIVGCKYDSINCLLTPADTNFEKLLHNLLPSNHRGYNDSLSDVVVGAIDYVAQYLVDHGFIILELVQSRDYNDEVSYSLVSVFSDRMEVKGDRIIQYPSNMQQQGAMTAEIPISKCFILEFPDTLGGKGEYLKFLDDFKVLGKETPMMNYHNNTLPKSKDYNLSEHQRIHQLELWKKSKEYYWPHRSGSDNTFTGHYFIYRHLRFRENKILLRNHIVEYLKDIVVTFSQMIGKEVSLNINGLISQEKIKELIAAWNSGNVVPDDVIKAI